MLLYYYYLISQIYYLVRFGSFFITVPSTTQGDFQYSFSFISPELIRISQAMLAAHPDKKLIAIKLIKINKYFILFEKLFDSKP